MFGWEEVEVEVRWYWDEVKVFCKVFEEGKERERRVGECLEIVMVSLLERCSFRFFVVDVLYRKIMDVLRKCMYIYKFFGRRRFVEYVKRILNYNL